MSDLLGSLVWGSQKQTILCVIGVGCYMGKGGVYGSEVRYEQSIRLCRMKFFGECDEMYGLWRKMD